MTDEEIAAFAFDAQMVQIDRCEEKFKADGDSMALFEAIAICAHVEVPLPRWASEAFRRGVYKGVNCEVASWDEAFGALLPKGAQLKSASRRHQIRIQIYHMIGQIIRDEKCAVDDLLFERVGKKFRVGKTVCKEIYYKARDEFGWFDHLMGEHRKLALESGSGRKER